MYMYLYNIICCVLNQPYYVTHCSCPLATEPEFIEDNYQPSLIFVARHLIHSALCISWKYWSGHQFWDRLYKIKSLNFHAHIMPSSFQFSYHSHLSIVYRKSQPGTVHLNHMHDDSPREMLNRPTSVIVSWASPLIAYSQEVRPQHLTLSVL